MFTNKTLNFIFIFYCTFFSSTANSNEQKKELAVKSAFIVKMTHFIEWPTFSQPQKNKTNFTICIDHSHKIDTGLENWAKKGLIKNMPVDIAIIDPHHSQLQLCDIFFLTDNKHLHFVLEQAKINHILTISDIPGNAARGIIVNFINIEDKLRFEINLDAATDYGFKFNPRLLKLATIVDSEDKE